MRKTTGGLPSCQLPRPVFGMLNNSLTLTQVAFDADVYVQVNKRETVSVSGSEAVESVRSICSCGSKTLKRRQRPSSACDRQHWAKTESIEET
jgi:hypothetical protein